MPWGTSLTILLGLVCALMALGLPVAYAFLGVNIVGALLFLGGQPGLIQLAHNSIDSLATFTLTPIPLFILMGEILFHTRVAFKAIDAVDKMIARVPGRLSIVSIIGGTIFASLSGSTIANTAMLGSILLPDMLRKGYKPSIAMGPIMATGGIAMLIPPSALAVLLGSLAGISISKLLIAGITPGIMMSVLFASYVIGRCALDPDAAPIDAGERRSGWERWRPFLVHVAPLFSIFFVVVGSMLAGVATPTEASALGSVAAVAIAAAYRMLSLEALLTACRETAKISVMILFIIMASVTFSQILAFSGATNGLLTVLRGFGLEPLAAVSAMVLILLFLGCFMDQVSMLMISLPFFIPLAQSLHINEIWLGVLILISMEIGFTTPPFGLILYVMKGVAPPHISMRQVWAAAMPFILLEILVLGLLMIFPPLATWLPAYVR